MEKIEVVKEDKSSSSPFAAARVIEEIIKKYEEYAEKNGFRLNSDRAVVERIVKGLLEREKESGSKFCPCRRVTDDEEENKKITCPCVYHKEEIKKLGHCLCNLFVK